MTLGIRTPFAVAILAGLVALGATTFAQQDAPTNSEEGARLVRTAGVRVERTRRTHRYPGVVRATQRARVAFTVGGRVAERLVEVGDHVVAGQALARLDGEPFRHVASARRGSLEGATARLDQSRRDVGRARSLHEGAVLSPAGLERSESGLESLSAARNASAAQLRLARRDLRETTLRAPFDGVVTATFVEVHEQVAAAMPVVALDGDGPREVEIEVPESIVGSIDESVAVSIDLPMRGNVFEGQVHRVGSARSEPTGLYPVIIRLSADALVGASAEVNLEIRGETAVLVPVEAVVAPTGGRTSVFRVHDGRAEQIPVEIAGLFGAQVALHPDPQTGLTITDTIVVAGHGSLLDGESVVTMDASMEEGR